MRIGNLVEGTRQVEGGRLLTKNLGVSVEVTLSIGSGLCPVLRCEEWEIDLTFGGREIQRISGVEHRLGRKEGVPYYIRKLS